MNISRVTGLQGFQYVFDCNDLSQSGGEEEWLVSHCFYLVILICTSNGCRWRHVIACQFVFHLLFSFGSVCVLWSPLGRCEGKPTEAEAHFWVRSILFGDEERALCLSPAHLED